MIGISLLTLNVARAGGTLTYARELVRALARVGELEYRVLVPEGGIETELGVPATQIPGFSAERRLAGMARGMLVPGQARRAIQAAGLDAVHFPVGVMLPRLTSPPAATSIQDLQHEELPQFFSAAQRAYRRRVYGWTIEASRMLVTASGYVRSALIERHGVAPERIRTIPYGIDHSVFTPGGEEREGFLLYPANRWPHKNHDRLVEAVALVRRDRPDLRLVLTGTRHEGTQLPDWVDARGHVSLDELVGLYRAAAALVFPSLSEGFGFPPLEAMACGCPVAVSRGTSLPEACGDAAVYFDPTSVEDIARGIDDVLTAPPAGGIEQAARFTWEECAHRHDDLYRELLG